MSKITVSKTHLLTGHNHSIFALAEGADPRYFYTGAGDGFVVEWDLDNPKVGRLIAKLPHSVYALAIDKIRNLLLVGHNFEGVHVIDLVEKKEIWSLKLTSNAIFDIKVFGKWAYIATGDGVLVVLDMDERSPVKHVKLSSEPLRVLALKPEIGQLAVGASDNSIKVLNLPDLSPVSRLDVHTNSVFALAYSPNGHMLVSGGRDAHLNIWDTDNFSLKKNIVAHMYAINYLSFREDGKYFVTCSMDKSIKLWDARELRLLKVIDKGRHAGHNTSVNKVIWSSYSQQVIAASDDRTVSIWDIEF